VEVSAMKLFAWMGLCAVLVACSGGNETTTSSTAATGSTTGSGGASSAASGSTGTGDSSSATGTTSTGTAGSAGAGGSDTSGTAGGAGGSSGGTAGSGGSAGGDTDGGGSAGGPTDAGSNPGDGGVIPDPGPASQEPFDWGKAVADTRIAARGFGAGYVDGLALHGIYLLYKRVKDPKYLNTVVSAARGYAGDSVGSLDSVMHMTTLDNAYEAMPDNAFKTGADKTRAHFNNYPKTDGVFWHSPSKTQQLWGDGVFMSLSFLSRYGTVFHDTTTYPMMVTNIVNTAKHLRNPDTGLLWHAYDATGGGFAIPPSNTNKISWGRAMGWWVMASVMSLEALPPDAPGRVDIENALRDLIIALAKYQDPATGLWYQVVDKGTDAENWLETSCSSMFSYGTWWAYKHRLVDASYAAVARKGLRGIIDNRLTKDANNKTTIKTICEGLNASTDLVGNYYHHAKSDNDPHGIGAFLLMWEGMQ
jgi:unsaturated rhamnogalacturonyl hydrolase